MPPPAKEDLKWAAYLRYWCAFDKPDHKYHTHSTLQRCKRMCRCRRPQHRASRGPPICVIRACFRLRHPVADAASASIFRVIDCDRCAHPRCPGCQISTLRRTQVARWRAAAQGAQRDRVRRSNGARRAGGAGRTLLLPALDPQGPRALGIGRRHNPGAEGCLQHSSQCDFSGLR